MEIKVNTPIRMILCGAGAICVFAAVRVVAQAPLIPTSPSIKFVQASYGGHPSPLDKGWYVSSKEAWVASRPGIVRTGDGGRTWRLLRPPDSALVGEIYDIEFYGPGRAWFSASSGVWQSDDRGESWRLLSANARLPVQSYSGHLSMTVAPSSNDYWSYTSPDSGQNWRSCPPDNQSTNHKKPPLVSFFLSAYAGFSIGMTESHPGYAFDVQRTLDGGCSWEPIWEPPADLDDALNAIYFVDRSHGWLGGDGPVYSTGDGGAHWQKLTEIAGIRITSMYFDSARRGWLLAYDNGHRGGFFATNDGGHNWRHLLLRDFPRHVPASWNRGQLALMLSRNSP